MKKLLLLIILVPLAISTYSQCFNADFSNGDFTNWVGTTGENSGGSYDNEVVNINQGTTNSVPSNPGQQTIMNAPGTDPNTGGLLSVLPPGGSSCARLGNELVNYGAERLYYQMNVNSTNCIFTYQYAVVLEDPSHPTAEQPKFTIYVLDSNLNIVDPVCGIYEVSAQSGIPGFQNSTHPVDGDVVRWKNWTTVAVDLSGFIGQTVTIQFTTYDCAQGAHFGYAYIACHCGTLQLQQQCMGSSDILTAPAGFSSYSWSTGGTGQSETLNNPVNGQTVTCTCTSVQGCNLILSIVLNIQPVTFTVNSSTICEGDNAMLTATGTGYTYQWSTSETTQSIIVAPSSTSTFTVTATASGGCSDIAQSTVTVNPLPAGNTTNVPSSCANNDGTITANITTGTAPYQFAWSTSPVQTTQTATGLAFGSYTVSVTDANGCSATMTGNVDFNDSINVTTTSTAETCGGAHDGTATANVTGGNGNYTYTWSTSPQQNTQTATGLPSGTYTVTVNDGICSDMTTVVVNGPTPIVVGLNPQDEGCLNECNGQIAANASGGNPPYAYLWNNSQNTPTATGLCVGNYSVTVTDANNCTQVNNASVATNTYINAAFTANPISGIIPLDVYFTFTGSGASTYLWNFGDGTTSSSQSPIHNYTDAGSYNVLLIINSGSPDFCIDSASITITAELPSFLIVPNVFTPNGDGINDLFTTQHQSIVSFDCTIFNRWGNKIYAWSDITQGWDGKTEGGKNCSEGVYYYIMIARGVEPKDYDLHGTVTLLRKE